MPYGNFTQSNRSRVVTSFCEQTLLTETASLASLSSTIEIRGGTNHGHSNSVSQLFRKYSFSKDGKSVRAYMGEQRIPVRRYRWVGPRANRRKHYYIVYVVKHIYVNIPKPQYSYRGAAKDRRSVAILRPNALNYTLDERTYPQARVIPTGLMPDGRTYVISCDNGLNGRISSASTQSTMNTRDPFSTWSWSPSSTTITAAKQDALRSLYEKVSSRFPDVGTMLGESKESISMLRKLMNEGVDFMIDLLKRDKARLAGRLKAPADFMSSAWLTYVYGIKPLISDIVALQELPNQYGIRTYKAKKKFSEPLAERVNIAHNLVRTKVISKYGFDVTYGVIMSADLAGSQKYAAMNLLNPIGVGYQLIPASFILDWFYDLGSFLNQQSALQYGFLYGWETVAIYHDVYEELSPRAGLTGWKLPVMQPLTFHRKYVSVVRKTLSKTSFPAMPTPKVELVQDSSLRGLNALALAVSRHKNK